MTDQQLERIEKMGKKAHFLVVAIAIFYAVVFMGLMYGTYVISHNSPKPFNQCESNQHPRW